MSYQTGTIRSAYVLRLAEAVRLRSYAFVCARAIVLVRLQLSSVMSLFMPFLTRIHMGCSLRAQYTLTALVRYRMRLTLGAPIYEMQHQLQCQPQVDHCHQKLVRQVMKSKPRLSA